MNYFQHNDSRGMESRLRVEAWRAERAKSADFDGTLHMSRYEVRARCNQARFDHGASASAGAAVEASYRAALVSARDAR